VFGWRAQQISAGRCLVTGPYLAETQSWLPYLLTDPSVTGAVAWLGLGATAIGLGIVIWQIRLARSAAEAAASAAQGLSAAIHSRERLLELSAAHAHLGTARQHIAQRDYSRAAVFVELARGACLRVRALLGDGSEGAKLYAIILRVTELIEALDLDKAEGQEDATAVTRGFEARAISNAMDEILARLRYLYVEDGTQQ
jgi:hypothetical protein